MQVPSGKVPDVTVDNEPTGRNFFTEVGWDLETGKPYLESLKKLGVLEVVIKGLFEVTS